MTRPKCVTLLMLGVLAVVSGCGSGPEPTLDRDATLQLSLTEYRITPEAIRVRGTEVPVRVHIVARNRGRLTHNVKVESIEDGSEQGTSGSQPIVFGGTATAQPGATVQDTVYLQPGTYRLTCSISNHDNLGQYGTLVVEGPDDG